MTVRVKCSGARSEAPRVDVMNCFAITSRGCLLELLGRAGARRSSDSSLVVGCRVGRAAPQGRRLAGDVGGRSGAIERTRWSEEGTEVADRPTAWGAIVSLCCGEAADGRTGLSTGAETVVLGEELPCSW